MTTTAEERVEEASAFLSESERLALADELSNRKLKFADVVKGQYEMLSEIEMDCIVALLRQPNLTQALRQAQNDKLEEAAALLVSDIDGSGKDPYEACLLRSAAMIRALKKD